MPSVLITAALSPLGRHFAELFGARGYRLLLNYRGPFHRVEGLLKEYGGEGIPFSFETGNLPEWLETVEELDPDVLVCNFGPLLFSPWREVEPSRWRENLESNLTLPFFTCRKALDGMERKGWGRVILVGFHRVEEEGARFPNVLSYASAKGGLRMALRSLAPETKGDVTVNMVSPTWVEGGIPFPGVSPMGRGELEGAVEEILKSPGVRGKNFVLGGNR